MGYIAESGVAIAFQSSSDEGKIAGTASIDKGTFVKGEWVFGRRMNGDQDHQRRHVHLPGGESGIQKAKLDKYK